MRWFFKLVRSTHAAVFRLSGGRVGASIAGMPMLLLATTGRRSGRLHSVPLGYLLELDSYVVIASYRGSPKHPAWYLNLRSEPKALVQVGSEKIEVIAKTVDSDAREQLWNRLVEKTPIYQRFQDRTSRQIALVYLTPVDPGTNVLP